LGNQNKFCRSKGVIPLNINEFIKSKIPIIEIFKSISGEGISAGKIVTFVRSAGCNLRCSYCDTTYSYNEICKDNEYLTPDEIVKRLEELGCIDIICTGGEPLETSKNKRFLPLYLAAKGFNVRIETNGSCPVYNDEEFKIFSGKKQGSINYVVDIKCPSSSMEKKDILHKNIYKLGIGDELKFVVSNEEDIKFSLEIIEHYKEIISSKNIIINFSPVFGKIEPKELAKLMLLENEFFIKNNLQVRLSLQIHKYIWNPETRGV
jgi:7-carboxy-7-deazaguanine synthase